MQKIPMKTCFRTVARLNIFINIQLINKNLGSNIQEHMKEQSWKNKACGFIDFEVTVKRLP